MPSARRDQQDGIREICRIYDMRDILKTPTLRGLFLCPLPGHVHANHTPSFRIWIASDGVQRFHCFGNCGKKGDIVDLVGYLHIPNYNDKDKRCVQAAADLLGSLLPVSPPRSVLKPKALPPNKWRYPLGQEVVDYAARRGLTPETLKRFKVGQMAYTRKDGASLCYMTMPAFEDGVLKAIKYRSTRQAGPRFWMAEGSRQTLFNYDGVVYVDEPLLVLKGEIPVMLMEQHGFHACCPVAGEGSNLDVKYRAALSFSKKRVLVGDNDANLDVRRRMQGKAKERAEFLAAEMRFPPNAYKDIDEWFLAEPETALPTIQGWLEG